MYFTFFKDNNFNENLFYCRVKILKNTYFLNRNFIRFKKNLIRYIDFFNEVKGSLILYYWKLMWDFNN